MSEALLVPGSPRWDRTLVALRGLEPRLSGVYSDQQLPRYIPGVTRDRRFGHPGIELDWVAVNLREVLQEGPLVIKPKTALQSAWNLPSSTKVLLVLTGLDDRLEKATRHPDSLVGGLLQANFDLVFGVALSTWDGLPPAHNRVAITHSSRLTSALAEAGLPVVPAAQWYQRMDMEDLAAAIVRNATIRRVWVDWSANHGGGSQWKRQLRELDMFSRMLPEVNVFVYGLNSLHRIRELVARVPAVSGVSSKATFISSMRSNRGTGAIEDFVQALSGQRRRVERVFTEASATSAST